MATVPITRDVFSSILANPELLEVPNKNIDDDLGIVMNWLNPDFTEKMVEPSPRIKTAIKNAASEDVVLKLYLDSIRSFFVSNALPYVQLSPTNMITDVLDSIDKIKKYYDFYSRYFESNSNPLSLSIFHRSLNSLLQLSIESPAHTLELKSLIVRYLFDSEKTHDFNSLITYTKILSIGLNDDLNSIIIELTVDHIKKYVNDTCLNIWDEPFITKINQWIELELYPSLSLLMFENGPIDKGFIENLKSLAYDELVSLRIKESFDIVVDFPDSSTALFELRNCIKTKTQRAELVNQFIQLTNRRLLHSGANTIDVITCYTSAIKSFLIIDPRGVLLDKICRPIRRYLKERDDIIPKIVHGLMDTSSDNDLIELAQELRKPAKAINFEIDDLRDLNWTPDPIDALPDFRKGKVGDVIESLISIFDSKDIFIGEFIQVFSQQLLDLTDYDINEVLFKLELLKVRFGESEFGSLDVMVRDVKESKRIDQAIHKEKGQKLDINFHTTILSHLYWPSLSKDTFKLPDEIQNEFQKYCTKFENLKQGRKLSLLPFLGTVKLDLELQDRLLEFNVSPDKAAIIYIFQNHPELSFDEICLKSELPSYLASRSINFWVKEGVLIEVSPKLYRVLETINKNDELDAQTGNSKEPNSSLIDDGDDESEGYRDLDQYWLYIAGMLTNWGAMPVSKMQTFLGALVPKETPYTANIKQLERFLNYRIDEDQLEVNNGMYMLKKK